MPKITIFEISVVFKVIFRGKGVEIAKIQPPTQTTSSHGNAKNHKDKSTQTLKPLSKLKQTPREIYKDVVLDDSLEAPRDFKQVRNMKYQNSKKEKQYNGRYKNNLADDILECITAVDTHEYVQHWSKSKGKMPNFVCYTENQREDLKLFLSQKRSYPIGDDHTFNLGKFFVTALVYKNLRVVRSDNASEHPLFIGPVFIHRDSTLQAYNYFFSTIKASLLGFYKFIRIETQL